jgi:energy-coupling factor transporter transmembrane protein EcfT
MSKTKCHTPFAKSILMSLLRVKDPSLSHKQCFQVLSLLFYLCISGVLIVMFFTGLCFGAFICLVFLVDGLPSLLFYIYRVFLLSFFFQLFENKCQCGATRVEQLLSMRDKLFFKSKTLIELKRQIKYSFKATHLNFFLQSAGYTG